MVIFRPEAERWAFMPELSRIERSLARTIFPIDASKAFVGGKLAPSRSA
jgi:hypothetical protein